MEIDDESNSTTAVEPTQAASSTSVVEDPFDLHRRFVKAQHNDADRALQEIRNGEKLGCWSWYMFPTAPYVVNGSERGSGMNRSYALRDAPGAPTGDLAAAAFLQWRTEGVLMLRENYVSIMTMVAEHLEAGIRPVDLVGFLDDPKLRSSLKLFERVSRGLDEEANTVCMRALRALKEEPSHVAPPQRSETVSALKEVNSPAAPIQRNSSV